MNEKQIMRRVDILAGFFFTALFATILVPVLIAIIK